MISITRLNIFERKKIESDLDSKDVQGHRVKKKSACVSAFCETLVLEISQFQGMAKVLLSVSFLTCLFTRFSVQGRCCTKQRQKCKLEE